MAASITPDGSSIGNRVENFGDRKLHAGVVLNVLNSSTLFSRFMGKAKQFSGDRMDTTIKITDSNQGQFVEGLENLNSAASDTTITLSYSDTAFTQPVVNVMLERFKNQGPEAKINLNQFKLDEAVVEMVNKMGTAMYGTGSSKQPLGLGAIVDDGTDVSTIGGQSRSTYSALNATRTASGGTLSLSKMATLDSAISAGGINTSEPTLWVANQTIFDLYESLLQPAVRASYSSVGYDKLPVRGEALVKPGELKAGAGFSALTYRGRPLIKDDKSTAQTLWALNENYLFWAGRTIVPSEYSGMIEKVSLGQPKSLEGENFLPSKSMGIFFQKMQMMQNQAGMIGRYWVIGQMIATQPRRNGRLTGITGV